jgi:hypothetical protein
MKEFFARLNPTERRFVVGVAVVFFLVINIVWVWPHFSDWGETRNKMNAATGNLQKFQGGANLIPGLKKEIEKYQKQGEVVPPAEQAVRFVRLIQNEESKAGVIHESMSPVRQAAGTTNNPYFLEQGENMTLQCSEKQLVDFLYNLGSGPSLIRVRALSLQPDPSHQRLTTRVTLVASYQKKAIGPAPAAVAPGRAPATASKPAALEKNPPAIPQVPKPTPQNTPRIAPKTAPATNLRPIGRTNRMSPGPAGAPRTLTPTNK